MVIKVFRGDCGGLGCAGGFVVLEVVFIVFLFFVEEIEFREIN